MIPFRLRPNVATLREMHSAAFRSFFVFSIAEASRIPVAAGLFTASWLRLNSYGICNDELHRIESENLWAMGAVLHYHRRDTKKIAHSVP